VQDEQVRAERRDRDGEEAEALRGDAGAPVAERPRAIEEVVAGHRDEEGARRGEQVVQARVQERRVDGEVDDVADRADRAELPQLHPVAARAQGCVRAAAPGRGFHARQGSGSRGRL